MKFFIFLLGLVLVFTTSYAFTQETTPPNNSIVTNLNQTISATISGTENVSTFIDWNNSLVGYWNFDSGNSTHIFDLSKLSNNATLLNGAISSSGNPIRGNNGLFDGSNNYINIPTKNIINSNSGTISMWFYSEDTSSEDILFYAGYNGGDMYGPGSEYHIQVSSGSTLTVMEYRSGVLHSQLNLGGSSKNNWHHMVFMWDTNQGRTQLILDANSNTFDINSGDLDVSSWTGNYLMLGGHPGASNFQRFLDGRLDEVMIFNRTLSDQEVLALYNSQANNFQFNATNLNNNTQYNYTIYSINTTGNLLQESYNFYTNTSYLTPTISSGNPTLFPLFSFISLFLTFSILFLYF